MYGSRREQAVLAMRQAETALVVSRILLRSRRLAVQLQTVPLGTDGGSVQAEAQDNSGAHQTLQENERQESRGLQAPLLRGAQGAVQRRSPSLAQSQLAAPLCESSRQAPSVAPRRDDLRLHAGGLDRGAGAVRLSMRVLQEPLEADHGSHRAAVQRR